ncbi:MAG: helix-turn-helix transcriptional regulator [Parvimonas sp.]|jgi:XRE family transcriptional regulator|nr:helix-turn-helix transcriptional regulator [Parvimonas sp.]DAX92818.1 MAG TPA: Repressor protein CI [Caudoviricetes sp.]
MNDNIREVFSTNLKEMLKERGKTQLELAEFVGVSDASVNNWVNGIKLPRMDKVDKICKFLNVKRSDLIEPKKPKTIDDLNLTGIERIAASHRDDEFTEEDLEDIQKYIDFVKAKRKNND